jgi:hypothetical protein
MASAPRSVKAESAERQSSGAGDGKASATIALAVGRFLSVEPLKRDDGGTEQDSTVSVWNVIRHDVAP